MDDGGSGIYRQFAREEARDRRRLGLGVLVALVVHALLLAVPWVWWAEPKRVSMPPVVGEAFELRQLAFAPPRPPAATPTLEDAAEPEVLGPPAPAQAEILLPPGPAAALVPPQPVRTPPPATPAPLWRQGVGAEVRLTVVVDPRGEVAEVTVLEVLPLDEMEARNGDDDSTRLEERAEAEGAARPPLTAEQKSLFGEAAAEAVGEWRFLPATFNGNPLALGIGVRVVFPARARAEDDGSQGGTATVEGRPIPVSELP